MKYIHRALKLMAAAAAVGYWIQSPKIMAKAPEQDPASAPERALESHRYVADLNSPRSFASRYVPQSRTIEIKVSPAKSEEFESSRYFNSSLVQRVIIKEKNSEVTLSFQMRDIPFDWTLVAAENPWRIVLDIFEKPEDPQLKNAATGWVWNHARNVTAQKGGSMNEPGASLKGKDFLETAAQATNPLPHGPANPQGGEDALSGDADEGEGKASHDKGVGRPRFFGRFEPMQSMRPELVAALKDRITESRSRSDVQGAQLDLAMHYYAGGAYEKAIHQFRSLSVQATQSVQENPKVLWQAGESAYLLGQDEVAQDYLNKILQFHSDSSYADFAKLRLLDISYLKELGSRNSDNRTEKWLQRYAEIARSEKDSPLPKIVAAIRLTQGNVDKDPSGAKPYHQILNNCVNQSIALFEFVKECSYIQTRINAQFSDVVSAYEQVSRYRDTFKDQERSGVLRGIVEERMTEQMIQAQTLGKTAQWIEIEKNLPAEALLYTLSKSKLVFARAQAWDVAGEPIKAARLFSLFAQGSNQEPEHTDALALSALGYMRGGQKRGAESTLKKLDEHLDESEIKMSKKAVEAIKILALAPHKSRSAYKIIEGRIVSGEIKEDNFDNLLWFAQQASIQKNREYFSNKIFEFSPKSPQQIQQTEMYIMPFAEKLGNQSLHLKSAEMFMLVAKIIQGNHKAEAAYKAGLQFARAGEYDKAKESWQLAASDVTEKRYSSLANERLERLK